MKSQFNKTKEILKENNIPFSTLGNLYILVDNEYSDELVSLVDFNLIVSNDPNTTLILPHKYDEVDDVYDALQYCNLYTGQ